MNTRDGMVKRLTQGTAVTLMRQVINVFGQLVLVPVYLKYWGNQVYGEWLMLSAAVAYLTLLDFGMQTYAVNRMNQNYTRGDMREFQRYYHSAVYFSLIVSGSAALLLLLGVAAAPLEHWFQLERTSRNAGSLTLAALVLQFTCSLPAGVIGGVYRAVGEYSRDVLFNNIQRGSVMVATALLLVNGGGIMSVAFAQLAGLLAHVAFVQWDLRRRHPEVDMGLRYRDVTLAMTFVGPSFLFFLMQMSMALTLQGTTLIMGAVAGAGVVAVFVSLRALANVIPQVAQALGATMWPELTALEAKRDYHRLRVTYRLASKLLLGFALTGGVFLYFAGPDVVRWWTGGRIAYDASMMNALIVLQVCQAWYLSSTVVLASSNNHKRLALCQISSAAIGLAVAAVLGPRLGPAAVPWSIVGAELSLSCWFIPRLACHVAQQPFHLYLAEVLGRGAMFGGVLFLATWLASNMINLGPVEKIAILAALSGLAAVVTLTILFLDGDQRRMLRSALRLRPAVG